MGTAGGQWNGLDILVEDDWLAQFDQHEVVVVRVIIVLGVGDHLLCPDPLLCALLLKQVVLSQVKGKARCTTSQTIWNTSSLLLYWLITVSEYTNELEIDYLIIDYLQILKSNLTYIRNAYT